MVDNDARKNAAQDLSARTGMKYTAAQRHIAAARQPRELRHRWQLTDDVRAFFAGDGWRNVWYGDLYEWLDGLTPTFECDWCAEDGDARDQDAAVQIVLTAYDPDVCHQTQMLTVKKFHAACKPSRLVWARQVDIPTGPQHLALPASAKPELSARLAITPRLLPPDRDEPDQLAALLLAVEVVDDAECGAAPWHNELELLLSNAYGFHLSDSGFGIPDLEGWRLRLVEHYPSGLASQWIAVRMPTDSPHDAPQHLYLGGIELPPEWVARARARGEVALLVGPLSRNNEVPELPDADDVDELYELFDDGAFLVGAAQLADDGPDRTAADTDPQTTPATPGT